MFGFGKKKKKKEEEKAIEAPEKDVKKTHLDKLFMGAIVGAAVGSVVGMSVKHQREKNEEEAHKHEQKKIDPKNLKKIPNEVE